MLGPTGKRIPRLLVNVPSCSALVQLVEITSDRAGALVGVARAVPELTPADVLAEP